MSDLLRAEGLRKEFDVPADPRGQGGSFLAVDDVSFTIARGETLGLVGESGCGKSTTARMLLRLLPASAGRCLFDGLDVFSLPAREMRALRQRMQIVFQDPYGSLNPRHSVRRIVSEGLDARGIRGRKEQAAEVARLLDLVGLPGAADRYPHEFSGGQRQRIGIARALSVQPEFLIADEPVSALDVSVQAQILNLLLGIQDRLGLTCLFVAHDLAVVRLVSHRIAVMYRGRLVEVAGAAELFTEPAHPYTRTLLAAVPDPSRRSPSPPPPVIIEVAGAPGGGCAFRPRCPLAGPRCAAAPPPLREIGADHQVACHLVE